MAKKKKSISQRRRENLIRQVDRMIRRGYRFDENIKETIKGFSPQKLVHFKSEDLYKAAWSYDYDSGERISGLRKREEERSEAARKGARTRRKRRDETKEDTVEIALNNLQELVARLELPPHTETISSKGRVVYRRESIQELEKESKDYILDLIDRQIDEEGRENFALRIVQDMEEISGQIEILEYGYYETDLLQARQKLANIIANRLLNTDEYKRLGAESERYEDWNGYGVQDYERYEE